MTHPLKELDGKRRYIFTADAASKPHKLFLRVVTSGDEIKKCDKAVSLLTELLTDAQSDLAAELEASGKKLKTSAPQKSDEEKVREKKEKAARAIASAPAKFGKEDNLTYFIIENEEGDAVLTLSATINNPSIARALDTKCPHAVLHGAIIAQDYRRQGIAAAAFDEIFSTISSAIQSRPIEIIAPITSREVINKEGELEEFLVHGEMYISMLKQACGDAVYLQPRLRNGWEGDYESTRGPRIPAQDLTAELIKEKMQDIRKEIKSGEDKSAGAFLIGDFRQQEKEYNEAHLARMAKKRNLRVEGIERDWQRTSPATSAKSAEASGLSPESQAAALTT